MKSLRSAILIAAALTAFAGIAAAHPMDRADVREARQHVRILEGRRHGDLTRHEARVLRRGQRHMHRVERRMWADGRMTWRERARMERMQDRQSWRIHRLRHNGHVI